MLCLPIITLIKTVRSDVWKYWRTTGGWGGRLQNLSEKASNLHSHLCDKHPDPYNGRVCLIFTRKGSLSSLCCSGNICFFTKCNMKWFHLFCRGFQAYYSDYRDNIKIINYFSLEMLISSDVSFMDAANSPVALDQSFSHSPPCFLLCRSMTLYTCIGMKWYCRAEGGREDEQV